MSTFDKMKAQEERRAAIKKQMEAMEAAAEPRSQVATPATARRRNTSTSSSRDSHGTVETARRFLVDEEDDDDIAPLNDPRTSVERRSLYEAKPRQTGQKHGESVWSSMKSTFSMLGSGTGKAQPATLGKSSRLAEVNLVGESQSSIVEEEEPVYHPSLCTSCYIGIRRLILAVALAIGGTYQYTRSRWEMAMGNGRGKKLLVAIIVIAAIVIPVSIVLTRDNGSSAEPTTDYSLTSQERHDFIYQRIVDSGLSDPEDLGDEGSPQQLALEWIVSGDHGDLSHEHDFLLQRYALAVFFYSTHGEFIHPPPSDEDETEQKEEAVDGHEDYPAEEEENKELANSPDWINQNRWMSSYGICAWHGIQCHHRPGTEPTDNSFDDEGDVILVNMTDNNIRGTIPKELFAAHPYMRYVSLAGNGIFGTLPSEIGYLDDIRKYLHSLARFIFAINAHSSLLFL